MVFDVSSNNLTLKTGLPTVTHNFSKFFFRQIDEHKYLPVSVNQKALYDGKLFTRTLSYLSNPPQQQHSSTLIFFEASILF